MDRARTNVYLPEQTWSLKLCVVNQHMSSAGPSAPTRNVFVEFLGARVEWSNEPAETELGSFSVYAGPPVEHEVDDPPPPDWPGAQPGEPPPRWWGVYYAFVLRITAPSNSEYPTEQEKTMGYGIWAYDSYDSYPPAPYPGDDALPWLSGECCAEVTFLVNDVYMRGKVRDVTPSGRCLLDYTDRVAEYAWCADDNAKLTVRAVGPDGTVLEASGPLVLGE